jgi:hypothetical protein
LAKRVRGQRSAHRPGGVGPTRPEREPTTRPAAIGSVSSIPPTPIATDARAPSPAAGPATTVVTTREIRQRTRLRSSGLDQKAAAETEWVTDDLRRIAVLIAIMLAGLAVAWILLVVVGLGDIY